MRGKSLKSVIALENLSIKEAMRLIDHSGLRVVYVVDEDNSLVGAVSDSEIRGAILAGKDIKQPVKDIVNVNPVILNEKDIANIPVVKRKIRKLLNRMPDSRYILVIDREGKPLKMIPVAAALHQKSTVDRRLDKNVMRVLIVGGAGYLGSVLTRKLLVNGFKVKVLDSLMYGIQPIEEILKDQNFELVEGDMRDISTLGRSLDGVDAVINLAAIVGDPACKNKPEDAIQTNFLANKVLAEACKYNQINRFLYASTCSVYGAMQGNNKLTENSPLNPVSLYARSKIQSEEGILSLEDENFSPTILRMSTLYGHSPRMRFDLVVNTMTKTAVIDKKISVHDGGKQWRPLVNVEDAAEAYLKCLRAPIKKIKGQIFNVGATAQNYQIFRIGEIVQGCIPDAKLLIEGDSVDPRNYFVSFSKIERVLKYKTAQELRKSVLKIKGAIENKEINDVNDPKYYNVEYNQ